MRETGAASRSIQNHTQAPNKGEEEIESCYNCYCLFSVEPECSHSHTGKCGDLSFCTPGWSDWLQKSKVPTAARVASLCNNSVLLPPKLMPRNTLPRKYLHLFQGWCQLWSLIMGGIRISRETYSQRVSLAS